MQYLSQSICILRLILACNSIRYRNGKDYIVEEVLPMVLKQIIQIINAKKGKAVHYEVLAECLSRCKAIELKADLILKSIEKINEEISKSAEPVTVDKLSHCHSIIMRQFFAKKELDMRREGLAKLSEELIWNEIRNHSAKKIDPAQPMGNVTIP